MAHEVFLESANACVINGRRLLEDAEMLEYSTPPATAFAIAIIAQEEFAKGFLLVLVAKQIIPWHPLIYRASRDHVCKQLLGIVMEYLNPDTDEFLRRSAEWQMQHKELMGLLSMLRDGNILNREVWQRVKELRACIDGLPAPVTDAIDILRYKKIERWKSSTRIWSEEPPCDPLAKKTGEGQRDREKQDALYVRLSRSGEVAGSPVSVAPDGAREAMERAKRFGGLVDSLIRDSNSAWHYEELERAMKLVFQDLQDVLPEHGEGE
jgi:AbiV family abortive infection protein